MKLYGGWDINGQNKKSFFKKNHCFVYDNQFAALFFFSVLIVRTAITVQNNIWWKYVDQEKYFEMTEEDARYVTDVPRPYSYKMEKLDYYISEICDFLQTFTVLILSVAGSIIAVFLFTSIN